MQPCNFYFIAYLGEFSRGGLRTSCDLATVRAQVGEFGGWVYSGSHGIMEYFSVVRLYLAAEGQGQFTVPTPIIP